MNFTTSIKYYAQRFQELISESKDNDTTVFDWHGYRAGLDGDARVSQFNFIEDLVKAGVTEVGVPNHHLSSGYVHRFKDRNLNVIRTIEHDVNPGLLWLEDYTNWHPDVIIDSFRSYQEPGSFFTRFLEKLQDPCDGVALNIEYDILTRINGEYKFPLSVKERDLISGIEDVEEQDRYIAIRRCSQIALIMRLLYYFARTRFSNCKKAVVFSGYRGLQYNHLPQKLAYGCDFYDLASPIIFRNHALSGITHAFCSYVHHRLPLEAFPADFPLPIYHGTQTWGGIEQGYRLYYLLVTDRLRKKRPQDQIGRVHAGPSNLWPYWNKHDRIQCQAFQEAIKRWKG